MLLMLLMYVYSAILTCSWSFEFVAGRSSWLGAWCTLPLAPIPDTPHHEAPLDHTLLSCKAVQPSLWNVHLPALLLLLGHHSNKITWLARALEPQSRIRSVPVPARIRSLPFDHNGGGVIRALNNTAVLLSSCYGGIVQKLVQSIFVQYILVESQPRIPSHVESQTLLWRRRR